jgi:hypothetical protein
LPYCAAPAAGATETSLSELDVSVSLSAGVSDLFNIESKSSMRTVDDRGAP